MAMEVSVIQRRSEWQLLRSANSTNTTVIAVKPATTTEPSAGADNAIIVPTRGKIEFVFFGRAADGTTNHSIFKWSKRHDTDLYIHSYLCAVQVTYASDQSTDLSGVSGYVPADTDFFADTITKTNGASDIELTDGVADLSIASLIVNPVGCQFLEIFGDRGTSTQWNGLYREIG